LRRHLTAQVEAEQLDLVVQVPQQLQPQPRPPLDVGSLARQRRPPARQIVTIDQAICAEFVERGVIVNGSSQATYERNQQMISRARSILDGETLADFVNALVERIEPRMNRTVMEIEDVAAGEEREDPMVMLDIAKDSLDGLADECDHAPHKFHRNSSRHASSSVTGVLAQLATAAGT
jgi:hypothetical protein